MSIFGKFFNRNRNNKNENEVNATPEPIRECDRRGRKLLFDSNAVEKIPLSYKGNICIQKNHQLCNKKNLEFIEVTHSHGYKYKNFSSDVTLLGEMIFGSVAMIYKGENSCKMHKLSSPKQIMFTTIVYTPIRCYLGGINQHSLKGSNASLNNVTDQKETSSSDSMLYKHETIHQKCSSTYPYVRHNFDIDKIMQCCDISDMDTLLIKKSLLEKDSKLDCLNSVCLDEENNEHQSSKFEKNKINVEGDFSSLSQKTNRSSFNVDTTILPSAISSEPESVSSLSGSLSSLRRRWNQSCSTSLDSTAYSESCTTPCKKRPKLGMAIILDLSSSSDDKLENFLFNHTIIMDSIMSRLQSSVELAYIKNDNFVDVIYNAFLEAQESIYQLIMGEKYVKPTWMTLIGDAENELDTSVQGSRNCEKNLKTQSKQEMSKLKFLNDFCDVLAKFDTKDTNFFISTLLTAVLTHHLSWVTAIAETDLLNRHEKVHSVMNYNPIWAQLNDLYGLLGSPLKCAKTIISGSESKKSYITSIIQVITYFIRCYNVVENMYNFNIDEIVKEVEAPEDVKSLSEDFDFIINETPASERNHKELPVNAKTLCDFKTEKVSAINPEPYHEPKPCSQPNMNSEKCSRTCSDMNCSLKCNKTCLSQFENSATSSNIYPDIKELLIKENINKADLDYINIEKTVWKLSEPVERIFKMPSQCLKPSDGDYISPDEGYNTIGSSKAEDFCMRKINLEKQKSASEISKDNVVFVLGENEELINVHKKVVVTRSNLVDLEREDCKELLIDRDNVNCEKSVPMNKYFSEESDSAGENWMFKNCYNKCEKTWTDSQANLDSKSENSFHIPWVIQELGMPSIGQPYQTTNLEVSSVFGGVNQKYNSEQVIQGILDSKIHWEQTLKNDLFLTTHNSIIEKDISEALCIIGDVDLWEVTIHSSNSSSMDKSRGTGIRVGMSQLVANMLESFLCLYRINLSPNFCLLHIEKKLREIYLKSKTVAELLDSLEFCSLDYLISTLDIEISDVPLLLSVATTHSPHISEKYGLSYT